MFLHHWMEFHGQLFNNYFYFFHRKYLRETLKMANSEDLNRLTACSLVLLGNTFLSQGITQVRSGYAHVLSKSLKNLCSFRVFEDKVDSGSRVVVLID